MQEFVEFDPTGRYGRYNEVLGRGSSKVVYRAFDEYEGIEVAWNQVKLDDFLQCPDDLERLYCEIHLLKTLKHKNIMKFYSSWVDISKRNINFVTEMFTSGTLRQFRHKHRKVHIRAVKNWCRQILDGLDYLHSHDPPIIHRDLKCDNILINGNQGEVKIGDLGLAAILRQSHAVHCVGTPEFMAPEVYEEEYNELVDIYSFGMCVLEMITFQYPYSECTHPAQIYKKVSSGIMPEALYEVKDIEVRQFIEKCLAPVSNRLSAKDLLMDSFLSGPDSDESDFIDTGSFLLQPSCSSYNSSAYLDASESLCKSEMDFFGMENNFDFENNDYCVNLFNKDNNRIDDDDEKKPVGDLDIMVKGKIGPNGGIFIRLRFGHVAGHPRNIHFLFNTDTDTALGVAAEMVDALDITEYEVTKIAELIGNEVSSLVPEWKNQMCIDDDTSSDCNDQSNVSSSYDSHLDYIAINEGTVHGISKDISYQELVTPQSSFGESQISDKKSEDDEKKGNKDLKWLKKMYNKKVKDWKKLLQRSRRRLNLSIDLDKDTSVSQQANDSKKHKQIQSFHIGKNYSYSPSFDREMRMKMESGNLCV